MQDVGFGWSMLRKSPGFTAVAVFTLALGIGATTAIFSAVNPILFEPLPYPQASRLMMIWDADGGARIPQTFHTYREVAERNRAFDSLAVVKPWQPTLTGAEQPERLDGQQVSASYFRTLGVAPAMGRDFQASEDVLNGPKVAILSHTSWLAHFGGDTARSSAVGIKLDDDNYTVIGVMPAGFENVLSSAAEVWTPLQYDSGNIGPQQVREWGHPSAEVGRLRAAAVSKDQAARAISTASREPAFPEFPRPAWASLGIRD